MDYEAKYIKALAGLAELNWSGVQALHAGRW